MQLLLAIVALVFNSCLYPDAGRVAPIRVSVWWLRLVLEETQALMGATRLASGKYAAIISSSSARI